MNKPPRVRVMQATLSKNFERISRTVSWVVITFFALFFSLYSEIFWEAARGSESQGYFGLITSELSLGVTTRVAFLFAIAFIAGIVIRHFAKPICSFLYRFRYAIAFSILGICMLFEISGSSLSCWITSIPGDGSDTGLLFGIPRAIRSDEWLVNLTLALSQQHNNFGLVSDIARGANTVMSMPVSTPSWSIITVFHPFQWGYLLFGTARGLSFEWFAPKFALFLISFECAMVYTKKNRALSVAAAALLSLSPMILWWNTGTMLVFGQGLVLALRGLLYGNKRWMRIFSAFCIAWLAGCFFFTLYPAWEVPFFFLFVLMGIWVILQYRRDIKDNPTIRRFAPKQDLTVLSVFCLLAIVGSVLAFLDAKEALLATQNTVYPGGRVSLGGGIASYLFGYGTSLLLPLTTESINTSELSMMFTLFPLGLIIGCIQAYRKRDRLLIMLVFLEVIFLIYGVFGFPEWLSKVTLMSYVPSTRLLLPLGCLDIIILIRSLIYPASNFPNARHPRKLIFAAAAAAIVLISSLCLTWNWEYFPLASRLLLAVTLALIIIEIALLLVQKSGSLKNCFAATIVIVLGISGLCVNPIQQGLGALTNNSLYRDVSSIASKSSGLWVAENTLTMADFCIAAGAPTVNSTNIYPDLERWHQLDPEGSDEGVYNRYAHIMVDIAPRGTGPIFELVQPDVIKLTVSWEDLQQLGVSYVLTSETYPAAPNNSIHLQLLDHDNGYNIYRIDKE